jgi:Fe-S-cluster containining protein
MLSLPDIFSIAKNQNREIRDVIDDFRFIIGANTGVPIFLMGSDQSSPDDNCIYLKGGKCSIHDYSPIICRLYPLGRGCKIDTRDLSKSSVIYQHTDSLCPGNIIGKPHTVEQWLIEGKIDPAGDQESYIWWDFLSRVSTSMPKKDSITEFERFMLAQTLAYPMYLNYDIHSSDSVVDQMKENMSLLWGLCKSPTESPTAKLLEMIRDQGAKLTKEHPNGKVVF